MSLKDAEPSHDTIEIMCSEMSHLLKEQLKEAKEILESYRNVITVSNTKIGCTHCINFDINTDHMSPISIPLCQDLLHQQEIKELSDHYRKLGLTEPIDSPFREATVLIQRKNVASSSHVTDKYRLCIDYRFVNNVLPDSECPAPSLLQCLDATHGSAYLIATDFSSRYHQIPCADRAKHAIAFSPGYWFGQWT